MHDDTGRILESATKSSRQRPNQICAYTIERILRHLSIQGRRRRLLQAVFRMAGEEFRHRKKRTRGTEVSTAHGEAYAKLMDAQKNCSQTRFLNEISGERPSRWSRLASHLHVYPYRSFYWCKKDIDFKPNVGKI